MSARTVFSRAVLTVTSLFVLSDCGAQLDEVWQLKEFRVLGVRLEPPEAERGATVQATLVTADPNTRPVTAAWIVSPYPIAPATSRPSAAPTGAMTFPVCTSNSEPFLLCPPGFQCACGLTPQFRVPATGGMVGSTGKETLTMLGYTCAGGQIRIGTDLTNPFSCTGEGSYGWYFTRTIVVRPAMPVSEVNTNPRIAEIRFGPEGMPTQPITLDAPPRVAPCADSSRVATITRPTDCPKFTFEVLFADGSRQAYNDIDPIAMELLPRQERLSVGFVVSAGRLDSGFRTDSEVEPEGTLANTWVAPDAPTRVRVLFYAADRRGGFDSTERAIIVE